MVNHGELRGKMYLVEYAASQPSRHARHSFFIMYH
jgi:hypothetical protein